MAEIWFRRHGQVWAGADLLGDALGSDAVGGQWVWDAIEDGLLGTRARHTDDSGKELLEVRLAEGHPLVEIVRYQLDWVPRRIRYSLQDKGLPYVDTKYLSNGMRMDANCQRLNVGQTRRDAERWLDRLAGAGWIAKRVQRHPQTPTTRITTWWALPNC